MFLLIEGSTPNHWCAKISEDNMLIQWEKGPNGEWTEPPWEKFYMPRYDKEFKQAMSDYQMAEVMRKKLPSFPEVSEVATNLGKPDPLWTE